MSLWPMSSPQMMMMLGFLSAASAVRAIPAVARTIRIVFLSGFTFMVLILVCVALFIVLIPLTSFCVVSPALSPASHWFVQFITALMGMGFEGYFSKK